MIRQATQFHRASRSRACNTAPLGLLVLAGACGRAAPIPEHPVSSPEAPPVEIIVAPMKPTLSKRSETKTVPVASSAATFGRDVDLLKAHTDVVVLGEDGDARVAVAPGYQGRVMTSTARGDSGVSYGWINREVVASGERQPHMNVFGGEDRFWLGPEGGQYGLYFPKGAPYDFDHWQAPEAIDWGGWAVSERTAGSVSFRKEMVLENHLGTKFDLRVDRKVALLPVARIAEHLGVSLPSSVRVVGYESENTITNTGKKAWSRNKGLVSIWILGMFQPSPNTIVVVPFQRGPEKELGPVVNDAYFGKVPESRLRVDDGVLFFRGDGLERGKIGIPRKRARPVAGSFDAEHGVLTIVSYTLPDDATEYVNSMWENQTKPYGGDVVNSYNDGSPGPGKKPLGPFYEIETSSPAAALAPGRSLTHVHRTIHLEGPRGALEQIAKKVLGVGLSEIEGAFAGGH